MSLHPKATHWFETYVPREQTVYALEALVATGAVELERDFVERPLLDTHSLRDTLARAAGPIERYADLLPAANRSRHLLADSPEHAADDALVEVRRWLACHLRLQRRLRDLEQAQQRLLLLRELLAALGDAAADLGGFGHDSRFLGKRIHVFPRGPAVLPGVEPPDLVREFTGPAHIFRVVFCLPEHRRRYDRVCRQAGGEILEPPGWLVEHRGDRNARLSRELGALAGGLDAARRTLHEHLGDAALARALADLDVLDWYLQQTVTLTEDRHRCYVTGWTTEANADLLQQALERARIDARILIRPAPPGHPPPVDIDHGRFTGPFRQFVSMFGTPGASEFDPAPLLPVMVPLLFGFMFPDVGHGLVLAFAGALLSIRFRALRFLVPCGLVAAVFGVLFGEFFGLHEPVPALLVRPLDEPMSMLLASLGVGVSIILLGLAISGIEAGWRGELSEWLWLDGAVLTLYLSAFAGLINPAAFTLSAVALFWYMAGLFVVDRHGIWRGLGRLAYSMLELVMNTLSFLRVGAFALAHAALSHALIEIAGMFESTAFGIIALVIGHLLIIAVEGLVVFVQTTRLVLFEFFTRFLRADGRIFRPLKPPSG